MKKGFLISIEGIDGAGKTTQALMLAARLTKAGYGLGNVPVFSDPPRTIIGDQVRKLVTETRMIPLTQLMLITAARADNYARYVEFLLDANDVVIYDRFLHSSMVYQKRCAETALLLHELTVERYPDKVFVLDLPVQEASGRIAQPDVMESVDMNERQRRREMFQDLSDLPELELIDVSTLTKDQVSDILYVRTMDFLAGVDAPKKAEWSLKNQKEEG